jgi:two-component system sensor histidine kinase QseC
MDSARSYSLKRRLVLGVLAVVVVVWLATAAYSYWDTRHEINELLDAHLAQSASLIVAQVGHDLEEIDLDRAPLTDKRARRVAFQIWERGSVLRLRSADAPSSRLSPREEGYSNVRIDGRNWRVFSTWDARRRIVVQIAERDETRREIAAGVATNLLLPLLFALPVLGLFVWISIGRAVLPLNRLGRDVERRKADDLRPLAPEGAPREVVPFMLSLNAMFERVGRLIGNERRFTADAAHELRTPLAALRTQAQVAKGATEDNIRQHALDGVIEGCDRATRLVDQLLTLARLEPDTARPPGRCDLGRIAGEVIAELAPFALTREVDIELHRSEPVSVEGQPELLSVLLRNLLDNAVRYSPRGSSVKVDVLAREGRAMISVSDQGPGVAPEERARLGERFHRILGTGQMGSGLGLSIVRRIVEIYSARLRYEEGGHGKGLRVVVDFRAATAT